MLEQFQNPVFTWCFVGVILLIIEFMLPGFVIFFFSLGAFIVALICLLFPSVTINSQLIIFLITSILTLVFLRKWFTNIFSGIFNHKSEMPKNIDSYVGKTAVVTQKISEDVNGKIEFHGTEWSAIANTAIDKGERVIITKQDNITFEVKKINNNKGVIND